MNEGQLFRLGLHLLEQLGNLLAHHVCGISLRLIRTLLPDDFGSRKPFLGWILEMNAWQDLFPLAQDDGARLSAIPSGIVFWEQGMLELRHFKGSAPIS